MMDTRHLCRACGTRDMDLVSPLTGQPICRECHAEMVGPSGRYLCPGCGSELHGDLLRDRIVVLWCAACDYARAFKVLPADSPPIPRTEIVVES